MMSWRARVGVAVVIVSLAFAAPATAGGFSMATGSGVYGAANSQTTVKAKSKYIDYKSNTFAKAEVESLYGGAILKADALGGNYTEITSKGKLHYKQHKSAKAKVYAKGGNVMAKARSENYVVIQMGGKGYVVTREVARAMARHTPLGTTAAADGQTSIEIVSNGYVGAVTGSVSKASVRVQN